MASPETIGTCACENCGATAYVKKNKGGFPYYRCGNCDKESREHGQKGARIFLQKVTLHAVEEDAAQAKPEAVKSEKKPAPPKRAPGSVAAFLLGE